MALYFRGMLLADYLDLVESFRVNQGVTIQSDVISLAKDALDLEAQNDDLRRTLVNVIRLVEVGIERSFELDAKISELKRKHGLDSKVNYWGVA